MSLTSRLFWVLVRVWLVLCALALFIVGLTLYLALCLTVRLVLLPLWFISPSRAASLAQFTR